jgi:hypothetical protein
VPGDTEVAGQVKAGEEGIEEVVHRKPKEGFLPELQGLQVDEVSFEGLSRRGSNVSFPVVGANKGLGGGRVGGFMAGA